MGKRILYQNNPHFIEAIQKYGCYFLCLYMKSGSVFSYENLNQIWKDCTDAGYIKDCVMMNPGKVAAALGMQVTYNDRHDPVNYPLSADQFAVGFISYKDKTHFVLLSRNKKIEYDPWKGGSECVKHGTVSSLRVFTYKE